MPTVCDCAKQVFGTLLCVRLVPALFTPILYNGPVHPQRRICGQGGVQVDAQTRKLEKFLQIVSMTLSDNRQVRKVVPVSASGYTGLQGALDRVPTQVISTRKLLLLQEGSRVPRSFAG